MGCSFTSLLICKVGIPIRFKRHIIMSTKYDNERIKWVTSDLQVKDSNDPPSLVIRELRPKGATTRKSNTTALRQASVSIDRRGDAPQYLLTSYPVARCTFEKWKNSHTESVLVVFLAWNHLCGHYGSNRWVVKLRNHMQIVPPKGWVHVGDI